MAGTLQPLGKQFIIVDEKGQPTDYFIRWAQQRQIDISKGVTLEEVKELISEVEEALADLADNQIIAGLGLSGGGPISSNVTIDLDASLDDLNDVDVSGVTEGQALVYQGGGWVPGNAGGGSADNIEPTAVGPSGVRADSGSHLWWRVNCLGTLGWDSIMLSEVQFRNTVGIPQLMTGGVPFANNYLADNVPGRAFDNNTGTFWHTAGGYSGWIGYQFAAPAKVRELSLRLRDGWLEGGPSSFNVEWSDDNGLTWHIEWTETAPGFTSGGQTLLFANPNTEEETHYYPTHLRALNDIDWGAGPTNGQVMVWDQTEQKFKPGTIEGGSGGGGGGGSSNILASARINCPDDIPEVAAGINVASVTKTGTGKYRVTFTSPIDITKAGFHGGGHWGTSDSRALMFVGIDRQDSPGLSTTFVDISLLDPGTDTYYNTNTWFSFTIYDVSATSGGGGSGGSFEPLWTLGGAPNVPKIADFTLLKSDAAIPVTFDEEVNGLHMHIAPGPVAGTDRTVLLERTVDSTTFSFEALIVGQNLQRNFQNIGLYVRNQSNNRFLTFGIGESTSRGYNVLRWNSPGNYNGSITNNTRPLPDWPLWLRLRSNAGVLLWEMSRNGKYWTILWGSELSSWVGDDARRIGIHYVASQAEGPQDITEHLHVMGWRQS